MKKIILVENDPAAIDVYREIFQKTDFDVEIAQTREEMAEELFLIKHGASLRPDLILMDLMRPGSGGSSILEQVKKDVALRKIPIFVLTNYENPDFEKDLQKNRIWPDKYLIKANHTPAELLGLINKHFKAKQKEKTRLA
ncbi:MAG TPA: response regulator [Candidatus Paceibacterota bacterium]|nr:response regulator [Candidatus Pacearchaeota archaeon]HRZ51115.1 response regulator [Candidatus Paceibacterota bacterium]HSA36878.1 response regulator [Candidatus Paceibacterota bacterium]